MSRDAKGCYITQEIRGVHIAKVDLECSRVPVLKSWMGGAGLGYHLFSKYWLPSRDSAMQFTFNSTICFFELLAFNLPHALCFVKVTLSWEGLIN